MLNRLRRWLLGDSPKMIGVYWGNQGTCAAYWPSRGMPCVAFEPASSLGNMPSWESVIRRIEVMAGIGRKDFSLAIALNADDVFLRAMSVPPGLSDQQLEQVAIVEAVANIPVPPEEICLDFVRMNGTDNQNEEVRLAFCRRERMDQILACAEEVALPAWVVDRDVQALHDMVQIERLSTDAEAGYPFAILLMENFPRLLICFDQLSIEVFPLRAYENTLEEEISSCWTRCRLSRSGNLNNLHQIVAIGMLYASNPQLLAKLSEKLGVETIQYKGNHTDSFPVIGEQLPPEEIRLIALGMARRELF